MSGVLIYPTHAAASRALCDRLVQISESAMAVRGRFIMALTGGNTPRMAYELLAGEFAPDMSWESSYLFWTDERAVPPDSPDSNARMARETLINYIQVPLDRVHRIHGEIPPEQAAQRFDMQLHHFFESRSLSTPRFDALLLGVGLDGQIASLPPGSPALGERQHWATKTQRDDEPFARISLTLPAINSAAHVLVLVTGAEKAPIIAQTLRGAVSASPLPSTLVAPVSGDLTWILDEAAAHDL
ncbi:MAG: 6-phosphogluconolactonase [Anaerolineae bacterium]|nr:6-phosphogluconolactonase [Anaerolineae bacterium]